MTKYFKISSNILKCVCAKKGGCKRGGQARWGEGQGRGGGQLCCCPSAILKGLSCPEKHHAVHLCTKMAEKDGRAVYYY